MKIGDIWWARRCDGLCVFKAKVTDITERTVEIEDLSRPPPSLPEWGRQRYVRGEFQFIELIEDAS